MGNLLCYVVTENLTKVLGVFKAYCIVISIKCTVSEPGFCSLLRHFVAFLKFGLRVKEQELITVTVQHRFVPHSSA